MKPVIFFDLDGVLADFVHGSFNFHGRHIPIADVRWDFPQQIGFSGTWVAEFWGGLDENFWSSLDALPDGVALLRKVEEKFGKENIGILSSPCDTRGCADGKRAWVARHFPEYKKRLFLGSAKEIFAGPGKCLIDDHDPNCDKFVVAGGKAVLVPRPWNERRELSGPEGEFVVDDIFAELEWRLGG